MDSGLQGKVAVVTGAAGGIGGATAAELADHGVKVLLVDVRGDEVAAKAEAIVAAGGEASAFTADVSTEDGVAGYVEAAVERYGTIDLFHNNAALEGPFLPLVDYDLETFDRLVAVNIRGVFLGLRAVLPVLLEKGSGRDRQHRLDRLVGRLPQPRRLHGDQARGGGIHESGGAGSRHHRSPRQLRLPRRDRHRVPQADRARRLPR